MITVKIESNPISALNDRPVKIRPWKATEWPYNVVIVLLSIRPVSCLNITSEKVKKMYHLPWPTIWLQFFVVFRLSMQKWERPELAYPWIPVLQYWHLALVLLALSIRLLVFLALAWALALTLPCLLCVSQQWLRLAPTRTTPHHSNEVKTASQTQSFLFLFFRSKSNHSVAHSTVLPIDGKHECLESQP